MQDTNPLQDVDLIHALHNDRDNKLAKLLVNYIDEAHKYIETGAKELSTEYQGYLNHLLQALEKSRYLLIDMAELDEDYDDDEYEEDEDLEEEVG